MIKGADVLRAGVVLGVKPVSYTHLVRFVDISTDKVAGDQPIDNIIRLKPKESGHEDGEILAIVTIAVSYTHLSLMKIVQREGVTGQE